MSLTRFKRRVSEKAVTVANTLAGRVTEDGPVSGSIVVIPIQFTESGAVAVGTFGHAIDLPAGMALKLIEINVQALGISGDPSISVGTTKAGTQIVAPVNATTNLGALTLKNTDITPGGILEVRVVNDADDSFDSIAVTIFAYVCDPPTSLTVRNAGAY